MAHRVASELFPAPVRDVIEAIRNSENFSPIVHNVICQLKLFSSNQFLRHFNCI